MQALGQIWLRMAKRLREAKMAHCDLQHGNVMFVPGSTANSLAVKLIDYDGMCVPALTGQKSGEVGHPAYQHPERLRTGAYNVEVDRFSLLSIGTALRCLSIGGRSLWERYDNGDNLLFRQSDLQAPAESPLFNELLGIGDAQARTLVKELHRACQESLTKVPLLTELVSEEKPAANKIATVPTAASAAIVPAPVPDSTPDWDFQEDEVEGKPRRSIKKKKRSSSGGMPGWVWGAMAGAAALLLGIVGVVVSLGLRHRPAEKTETPVAQIKPATKTPKPAPTPPPDPQPLPGDNANNPPQPQPMPAPVNPPPPLDNPPDPPPADDAAKDPSSAPQIILLSPAGDAAAISSTTNGTWRLMDAKRRTVIREFVGHDEPITAAAFSADGRRALTGSRDKTLRLWEVPTGQVLRVTKAKWPILGVALSPDGRRAAYFGDLPQVNVLDIDSGRSILNFSHSPTRKIHSAAFSADNQQLLCGFSKEDKTESDVMILWNVEPAHTVRLFRAAAADVSCVALSPDGKYVAGGLHGATRLVSLWETASGRLVRQMRMIGPPAHARIHQLAFSPDSRLVLAAYDRNLHAWHVSSGQHGRGFGSGRGLISGEFSADSKQMLIATADGDKAHFFSVPILGVEDKIVDPPQQLPTPDAWAHLDVPRDILAAAKNDVLRIPSGKTVATRQEYNGPLDITIVVRGPENHDVSFIAPGGAMVTFRRTGREGHVLNVRRPDKTGGQFGTLVGKQLPITLPVNQWCTLHWEIKSTGMKVAINKQVLFQEAFRYDLTAKYPVKIRVNSEAIELKSLVVKSLKK